MEQVFFLFINHISIVKTRPTMDYTAEGWRKHFDYINPSPHPLNSKLRMVHNISQDTCDMLSK